MLWIYLISIIGCPISVLFVRRLFAEESGRTLNFWLPTKPYIHIEFWILFFILSFVPVLNTYLLLFNVLFCSLAFIIENGSDLSKKINRRLNGLDRSN